MPGSALQAAGLCEWPATDVRPAVEASGGTWECHQALVLPPRSRSARRSSALAQATSYLFGFGGQQADSHYRGGDPGGAGTAAVSPGTAGTAAGGGSASSTSGTKGDSGSTLTFLSPMTNKQVQVSAASQDACIESCKNAPELKDQTPAQGGTGGGGMMGGLTFDTVASAATGGETANIQACVRFCQAQFQWHCFPGDSTVTVCGKGRVPLSKLVVGDKVLAIRLARNAAAPGGNLLSGCCEEELYFDSVLAWIHRDPLEPMEVVRIQHSFGQVHMSPGHLLFTQHEETKSVVPVLAKHIRPGDRLLAPWIDGSMSHPEVLATSRCQKIGLFAPLVDGGTILVDGTAASCYAIPRDIAAAPLYRFAATVADGMAVQSAAHAVFLPLRILCHAAEAFRRRAPAGAEKRIGTRELPEAFKGVHADMSVPHGAHPYAWVLYMLGASLIT